MAIDDIVKQKSRAPITVKAEMSLDDAVATMVEHNVGCVLVTSDAQAPIGILSERDILRLYNQYRSDTGRRTVGEVMTREPQLGALSDDEEDVLNLMTRQRFRHLPIVQDGKLVGVVSLGDLVKARMAQKEEEAQNLKDYIYS